MIVGVDHKREDPATAKPERLDPPRQSILRMVCPGILLVLVCLIPYLNKAYTIDDPWFLLEARQILKTPFQPMSYAICWSWQPPCIQPASNLGPGTVQSLMGYLLVPGILAGGAEWIAHLLQILLACLAVIEIVKLALRLGFNRIQAACAGLLLAVLPPFLAMASTAMPDLSALTLGLTGIERLLAWKEERRWHQAVLSSLTLGLAPYARPHLALLMALGALWLFDDFRFKKALAQVRQDFYLWTPILAAACILITVNVMTRDRNPAYQAMDILTKLEHVPLNLYAYLIYFSLPIPFTAVWLAYHWRKAPLLVLLPAVPFLTLHFMLFSSQSLLEDWPKFTALYSLVALSHMIYRCLRETDRLGLFLGLWLLIPLPAIIYIHLPIKYLVPVLPAIVLILIRILPPLNTPRAVSIYGALMLVCTAYSCLLLRADADFAEGGRRASEELIAPHVAAGEKVWYSGYWGFYWYAEKEGAKIYNPDQPGPKPGELLAIAVVEGGKTARDHFPNRDLVDSRHYDSPHGRTVEYGGGLYTNRHGLAPWVWNPKVTNDYELWRIR